MDINIFICLFIGHLNYQFARDVQQMFAAGFKKTLPYPDIPTMFVLCNSSEKYFICQISSVSDSWSVIFFTSKLLHRFEHRD